MTESIIAVNTTESMPTFKNPALADATAKIKAIIDAAVVYADDKNKEIAKVLGKVKVEKSYVEDGYKSVDDYAQKVFNIKRANAYAMAAAGEFYNDEKTSDTLKSMPYSKLAELARADRTAVDKAVEDGTIKANATQKDLRQFANDHKAKDAEKGGKSGKSTGEETFKGEVVKTYKVRFVSGWGELTDTYSGMVETDDFWDVQLSQAAFDGPEKERHTDDSGNMGLHMGTSFRKAEIIKLPKCQSYLDPNGKKKTVLRKAYITDKYAIVAEFYESIKDTKEEQITVDYSKLSVEELQAMLAKAQEALKTKDSGKSGKKTDKK